MSNETPALRDNLAVYASKAPEMERVPPGYRQTNWGAIPEDWELKTLAEACIKIQDGTHFSPRLGGNEFLYVTSKNIGFGTLDISHAQMIDAVEHRKIYQRCDVRRGDLLLTKDGANTGNAAINYLDEEFSLLSSVALLRFDPELEDAEFYLQCILSNAGQRAIKESMSGNAITRLTLEKIRKLTFPYPPIAEQRAIAAALSDVDVLINLLDKLISKKRAVKTAAMQQLLTGKRRLRGFAMERGYKRTEIGDVPKDWSVITMGELFTFKNGLNKAKEYFGHGTPIVNYMDVYNRCGIYAKDILGRVSVDKQELKSFSVRRGDVFFTRTSETVEEIGIAAVMLDQPQDAVFSGFVLRARPKDDSLDEGFKAYCFASFPVRKQITSKSTYTTRALTNGRVLSAISIACPPREEQTAIATVLSDMDAEIEALEVRREKTRMIKQGMMQELITGRTRLVPAGA